MKEVQRINLDNNPNKGMMDLKDLMVKKTQKLNGDIKATPGYGRVKLEDKNSGVFGFISRYNINTTIPAYSVILRIPESMGDSARGLLTEGCIDNVDIATTTKRRKRAAESAAAAYDKAETGDIMAGQMASSATCAMSSIQTDDKSFANTILSGAPTLSSTDKFLFFIAGALVAWLM